ncbi:flagellar filament capping protein FliD, partial [Arthrospira platensis SPKY1]|nr:flagellar filament capping protein FliD [Arthrospira platensis SPKY1]
LTLTRAEAGVTSSLTVADDRSGARAAIDGFVKAYNDAVNGIRNLTAFNAETRQAAALTGDSTARGLQNQLRNIVGGAFAGLGDTDRLADIGITFQLNGTLSVDNTRLTAALNDPT